jgi:eukaryotic-like serine/threonine-protein kinase
MSSVYSNCEGQGYYGELGYVFVEKPADVDTLELWRCNMGEHHFESVANCEGYTKEGRLGWVLSGP